MSLNLKTPYTPLSISKVVTIGREKNAIKTKYINKQQKSPESASSNPNFSDIKNPMNPANIAAAPPDTIS